MKFVHTQRLIKRLLILTQAQRVTPDVIHSSSVLDTFRVFGEILDVSLT